MQTSQNMFVSQMWPVDGQFMEKSYVADNWESSAVTRNWAEESVDVPLGKGHRQRELT